MQLKVENYEYEIEDNIQSELNSKLIKALIDMLYKNNLINKKEHTSILKQFLAP